MNHPTSKLKTIINLITPSVSGLVLYSFLAALTMVLNQFDIIKRYLELPHNLQLTQDVARWADRLLTSTIGESRTETLVVGLFWAIVGLAVYLFLRTVAQLAVELDDDIGARGYVWPRGTDRYHPLRLLAEQIVFRLAAVVGLVFLIIGPVAAMIRGPLFVDFLGPNKPLQFVVWFVCSVLVWHAVIVLVRLAVLKARLFG